MTITAALNCIADQRAAGATSVTVDAATDAALRAHMASQIGRPVTGAYRVWGLPVQVA